MWQLLHFRQQMRMWEGTAGSPLPKKGSRWRCPGGSLLTAAPVLPDSSSLRFLAIPKRLKPLLTALQNYLILRIPCHPFQNLLFAFTGSSWRPPSPLLTCSKAWLRSGSNQDMLPVGNLFSNYPLQISSHLRAFSSHVRARPSTHCWAQSCPLRCLVPETNGWTWWS